MIKLLGDLEPDGRMARILIAVEDPLDLAEDAAPSRIPRPPLLIGEYVTADIEGSEIADVFRIPRTALRDDDHVWIATPNGTLSIQKVSPLWRGSGMVLVADGLREGDRLIVSGLPAPVAGMPVRIASTEDGPEMRLSESSPSE